MQNPIKVHRGISIPLLVLTALFSMPAAGAEGKSDAPASGPFKKLFWGKATEGKDGSLNLHVMVWPNGSDLIVPVSNKLEWAKVPADEKIVLTWTNEADGVHIKGLPAKPTDPRDPIVAIKLDGPAQVLENRPKQQADGTLVLLAADCDVHATNAKLEKKGDRPYNIGYWTNVKDTVSWDITIEKGGTFTVDLEYSLGGKPPGSEINIEFGKEKSLPVKFAPGKDFLDFKTMNCGQIELPAGAMTIIVRPVKKSGVAVMDLRRIELKRVK
jgi:hypothetical protein